MKNIKGWWQGSLNNFTNIGQPSGEDDFQVLLVSLMGHQQIPSNYWFPSSTVKEQYYLPLDFFPGNTETSPLKDRLLFRLLSGKAQSINAIDKHGQICPKYYKKLPPVFLHHCSNGRDSVWGGGSSCGETGSSHFVVNSFVICITLWDQVEVTYHREDLKKSYTEYK